MYEHTILRIGSIGQRLRNVYEIKKKKQISLQSEKKYFTPLLTNKNKSIIGDIQKNIK